MVVDKVCMLRSVVQFFGGFDLLRCYDVLSYCAHSHVIMSDPFAIAESGNATFFVFDLELLSSM